MYANVYMYTTHTSICMYITHTSICMFTSICILHIHRYVCIHLYICTQHGTRRLLKALAPAQSTLKDRNRVGIQMCLLLQVSVHVDIGLFSHKYKSLSKQHGNRHLFNLLAPAQSILQDHYRVITQMCLALQVSLHMNIGLFSYEQKSLST